MHIPKKTILSLLIGVTAGLSLHAYTTTPQVQTQAEATETKQTTTQSTPTASSEGEGVVAGAQTTVTAPQNVEVVMASTTNTKPKSVAKKAGATVQAPLPTAPAPNTAQPVAPLTPPVEPTPETIVVNLKTPQTYTMRAGDTSPMLYHEMTDDVPYEWQSGLNTSWQNEPPASDAPVWAVIQLDRPAKPYVSDLLPFIIHTKADTAPGAYKVRFTIIIRPGVSLDVPVVVTITDK